MSEHPSAATVLAPSVARRRAGAVALIVAAVAGVLQALLQPVGSDGSAAQQVHSVVLQPGQATAATACDLLNWALALPGAIAVWGYLRGRGRVLASIATIFIGLGAFAVAFGSGGQQVTLRLAQVDPKVGATVTDTLGEAPLFAVFIVFVYLGLIGFVLLSVAAARGRLVPRWVPVILVVGLIANVLLDNDLYGLPAAALYLLPGIAEVMLAVGLFRSGSAVSSLTGPELRRASDAVAA